jgi:hypothetical protein
MKVKGIHTYPDYGWDDIQKELAGHKMTILLDQGLYRHIRFLKPDTIHCWFELVTFPNVLVIHGDMGTYVFSRIEDMFQFFRQGKQHRINPGYWAEKIEATEKNAGHYEFSEEKAREAIAQEIRYLRQRGASNEVCQDLLDTVSYESQDDHISSVVRWECRDYDLDRDFSISDYYEHDFEDYTYWFLWCLHAIVWGIESYDSFKDQASQSSCLST